MQEIYRRTLTPKCNFNKVALQLYWNDTSAWVFSRKFVVYFQNSFYEEHLWAAASARTIDILVRLSTVTFFQLMLLFCSCIY